MNYKKVIPEQNFPFSHFKGIPVCLSVRPCIFVNFVCLTYKDVAILVFFNNVCLNLNLKVVFVIIIVSKTILENGRPRISCL